MWTQWILATNRRFCVPVGRARHRGLRFLAWARRHLAPASAARGPIGQPSRAVRAGPRPIVAGAIPRACVARRGPTIGRGGSSCRSRVERPPRRQAPPRPGAGRSTTLCRRVRGGSRVGAASIRAAGTQGRSRPPTARPRRKVRSERSSPPRRRVATSETPPIRRRPRACRPPRLRVSSDVERGWRGRPRARMSSRVFGSILPQSRPRPRARPQPGLSERDRTASEPGGP
jgi:hypothetical protein